MYSDGGLYVWMRGVVDVLRCIFVDLLSCICMVVHWWMCGCVDVWSCIVVKLCRCEIV